MSLIENLETGFAVAANPINILFCFLGCLLGTLVGVLPGIGTIATIAVLLPVTFGLQPETAIIMLAGIYYGAQYGGSTTSILVNMPGEASSIVTCLDGHQMAKNGRGGVALSIAALASLFAGIVGTIVVAAFAPALGSFANAFRSPEYCLLLVFGLLSAVVLSNGSPVKAVAMIFLGLLIGLVGQDPTSGTLRYTFGIPDLVEGLDFVAVSLGLFGLSEVMNNLERNSAARSGLVAKIETLWPRLDDIRTSWRPALRGTALGSLIGILPGGAATISSFASYALERRVSRTPDRFGRGAIEGVAGPEAANNAASQTSFIPLLTLGIPSNAVMALMAGALMIQGIVPGPQIITEQPNLFWGLIVSMLIGNVMLVIINLPLVGIWVRLLKVPYRVLFPMIVIFCAIGIYSTNNSAAVIMVLALFAFLGYLFAKLGCECAPFILGFILGPLMEENFRRSMALSRGSLEIFVSRPLCIALLIAITLLLLVVVVPSFRKTRDEAVFED